MTKQIIEADESGLVVRTKINENNTELYDKNAAQDIAIASKATSDHTHTGVYEPVDGTILRNEAIGVSVEAYDASTVKDGSYVHTDENFTSVEKSKLGGVEDDANNYSHPATHPLAMIDGAGTAAGKDVGTSAGNVVELDGTGKLPAIDGSQLTNVTSLSSDQQAALDGAATPSGTNVFATMHDVVDGDMKASIYDPSNKEADVFAMENMNEDATHKILTSAERLAIATNSDKTGITPEQSSAITSNTSHRENTSNPHGVNATSLGLSAVDNTSDADKPLSTAATNALSGKSDTGHNHSGVYEPANTNIQAHISSAHAPSNAQKNSDVTKAEIEAKLTGTITTHKHAVPIGVITESTTDLSSASFFLDEVGLTTAHPNKVPSQKSVKNFVDTKLLYGAGAPGVSVNPVSVDTLYVNRTTGEIWQCTDSTADANTWKKTTSVLESSVLVKNNNEIYEPSDPYNPATKKYVDDSAGGGGGGGSSLDATIALLESIPPGEKTFRGDCVVASLAGAVPKEPGDGFYSGVLGIAAFPYSDEAWDEVTIRPDEMYHHSSFRNTSYKKAFAAHGNIIYDSAGYQERRFGLPYELLTMSRTSADGGDTGLDTILNTESGYPIIFTEQGDYLFLTWDNDDYIYKTDKPFMLSNLTLVSHHNTATYNAIYLSQDGKTVITTWTSKITISTMRVPFDLTTRTYTTLTGNRFNKATFLDRGNYLLGIYNSIGYLNKCATPYDVMNITLEGTFPLSGLGGDRLISGQDYNDYSLVHKGEVGFRGKHSDIINSLKARKYYYGDLCSAKSASQYGSWSYSQKYFLELFGYCVELREATGANYFRDAKCIGIAVHTTTINRFCVCDAGYVFLHDTNGNLLRYTFDLLSPNGLKFDSSVLNPFDDNYDRLINYSPDGTKAFTYGSSSTLKEYAVTGDPYSMAFTLTTTKTLSSPKTRQMFFTTDGTKYVTKQTDDNVTYDLATGFDLSTINTTGVTTSNQPWVISPDMRYGYAPNSTSNKGLEELVPEGEDFTKFTYPYTDDRVYTNAKTSRSGTVSECGRHLYWNYCDSSGIGHAEVDERGANHIIESTVLTPASMGSNVFISVNPDGSILTVIIKTTDKIIQYLLPKPFHLAGAVLLPAFVTTRPIALFFNHTGSKCIVATAYGSGTYYVRLNRYSLSTPYNVGNMTADSGQEWTGTDGNLASEYPCSSITPKGCTIIIRNDHSGSTDKWFILMTTPFDLTTVYNDFRGSTTDESDWGGMYPNASSKSIRYAIHTDDYEIDRRTSGLLTGYGTGKAKGLFIWTSPKVIFSASPSSVKVTLDVPNHLQSDLDTCMQYEVTRDGTTWEVITMTAAKRWSHGRVILQGTKSFTGAAGINVQVRATMLDTANYDTVYGLTGYIIELGED